MSLGNKLCICQYNYNIITHNYFKDTSVIVLMSHSSLIRKVTEIGLNMIIESFTTKQCVAQGQNIINKALSL